MIKGKKALFSMIVGAMFMVSSITTPADAMNNDAVLQSRVITTKMEVSCNSNLNIRSGSGTKYKRIGYAKKGQILDVISISKGWAKISYKGSTAYVSAQYLKNVSSSQQVNEEMIVKVNVLNVRSGSSTNHKVLGKLNKNDKVKVVSTLSNGWLKIEYKGAYAYVSNTTGTYLGKVSQSDSSTSTTFKKIEMITKVKVLNVRSGSSTKHSIIGRLSEGDIVVAIEKLSNGWMKVEYNGKIGYVSNVNSAYLNEGALVEDRQKANEVIDLINALPKNITLNDKSAVNKARTAYNSLNNKSKTLVTNLNKLVDIEHKIEELEVYNENVKKVEDRITTLDREILYKDYSLIKEIRTEFNTLSKEEQKLVSNVNILINAEKQMEEILNRVHNVISLINKIPEKISLEDKAMIQNVRKAYDALKDDEKESIKGITLSILISAEIEINRLETIENNEDVKKVISLIESLPDVEKITYDDKEKVMSVLSAFRALPEELKYSINITKLMDAVDKIEIMDAEKLVEEIKALPSVENITKKDKEKIESIRAKYDAISIRNNKRVTNLNDLIAAEKELKRSTDAVNAVESLINSIPETSKITLDDKALIEKVRAEYEALLSKDKDTVDSQSYKVLVEAEEKIKDLQNSPQVKSVNDKINSLMDKEITLEDKDLVQEIRQLYDNLHSSLKEVVNVSMIEELEMKIDELETYNENAKKMEDRITALDRDILYKDYSLIKEIRTEFNALSQEEQKLVSNVNILINAEKQMEEILNRVHNVISLINKIPEKVSLEDKAMIQNVRKAYDALKDDEKESIKGITLSILISAEIEINRLETIENNEDVKKVISLIESLPDVEKITYDDKEKVMSVLSAFRALQEELKHSVDITKLIESVDKIEIMDAEKLVEEIKALPSVENITENDKEKIESIRARYNAISIRNNKRVTNLNDLIAAEKALEKIISAV